MKAHKALLATMLLARVSLFFSTSCTYRSYHPGHQGPPPNAYYAPGQVNPKKHKKTKKHKHHDHHDHHHDHHHHGH